MSHGKIGARSGSAPARVAHPVDGEVVDLSRGDPRALKADGPRRPGRPPEVSQRSLDIFRVGLDGLHMQGVELPDDDATGRRVGEGADELLAEQGQLCLDGVDAQVEAV
jgi:hypothetical protein